ncbi:MAG: PAS domain S-box-containing protein [Gammaproteobacteria bacterium]|jgi:PAS domain S-box-containing protein
MEWNATDNQFYPSQSWLQLFGYSAQDAQVSLQDVAELAYRDDLSMTRDTLIKAMKGEIECYETQQRMRHKDGHFVHCLIGGTVVERDRDGRAIRLAGTHTDITELNDIKNALRESNERLNIAFDIARHDIWEWNVESVAFSQYGNLTNDDNLSAQFSLKTGAELLTLIHPEDRNKTKAALTDYLQAKSSIYSIEHRVRLGANGYRLFLSQGQAIQRDSDGRVTLMLGTHTDVSDLRNVNHHLELALKIGRQGLWE